MKKFIIILLIFSFLFPQNPCNGTCYSDEEVLNIDNHIQELEKKSNIDAKMIENLNSQIYMYIQQEKNDSLRISLYEEKLILLDNRLNLYKDLVKEVKPKWYENKWIWFGFGVIATTGSVKLAGEIIQ
jgi:uncharacterized coiled-coil protein SlyX